MKIVKFILLVIGILFILMIIGVVLMGVLFIGNNNKEQTNQETVITGGEKNALLLFQNSRGGLTKKAADKVAENLKNEGYTVVMNHPRSDLTYDLNQYEAIVLMTPVYAGQIAKPLTEYADDHDFAGRKVCVIVTGSAMEETTELDGLKDHIQNAEVLYGKKIKSADNEEVSTVVKEFLAQ